MVFILGVITILLSVVLFQLIRTRRLLDLTLPASPHAIILSKFVGALVASLYRLFLLFLSGFITIIVMGAVIGQDILLYLVLFLRPLVILLLIGLSFGGFLPQLRDLPILCIDRTGQTLPKSSWIEGYSVFLSLVHCFKYHRYSINPLKIHMLLGLIGLWRY